MTPLDPVRVTAARHVLVVAPHPDDEAVGCGGTVHLAARAGATVAVVVLTRGDGGIDPLAGSVSVETRQSESRACCRELGTEAPLFAGLESGTLRADPALGARALRELTNGVRFDRVLVPSPLERHATHRASLVAALLAGVATDDAEVWGWGAWDAIPAWDEVLEVDVTAARMAKTLAVRAHASQDRPRALAAATLARDSSQAAFSSITGHEQRKAVERLLDLSTLVAGLRGDETAAGLSRAIATWTAERSAAWAQALWSTHTG